MVQITLQFENVYIKNRLLKVIELMKGVSVVKPNVKEKKNKSGLDEALEDVKSGRISEYASVDAFFFTKWEYEIYTPDNKKVLKIS